MKNIDNLHEILQTIIKENPKKTLLVNDYFRIPKNNEEFLRKYENLSNKEKTIFGRLILELIFSVFKILLNLFVSFFYIKQSLKFNKRIEKTNELFISHGISSNTQSKNDIYYEEIPNEYIKKNKHVTILYLNHMNQNYLTLSQKLSAKNNSDVSLLMPKFMGTKEYINYMKFNFQSIFERIKLYNKYRNNDKLKSKIVLNSIFSLTKRETYSNYHLLLKCKLILQHSIIENVFLTLEGHAYEELVINETSSIHPKSVVWLRQHSPISLAQTGVINTIESLKQKVNILTTGTAYAAFLNNYSSYLNVIVIGTSKSRSINIVLREGDAVLVAPEGTEKSTLDFLNFLYTLDSRFDKYDFIFRMHPNLSKNYKIRKQIRKNKLKHNFRLSNQSLDKDLMETCSTLYRGSAVAIESLAYNNLPIYLNFDGNTNLNVFSILKSDFPTLKDTSNLSEFFDLMQNKNYNSNGTEIYNKLFEPLSTTLIAKLFI